MSTDLRETADGPREDGRAIVEGTVIALREGSFATVRNTTGEVVTVRMNTDISACYGVEKGSKVHWNIERRDGMLRVLHDQSPEPRYCRIDMTVDGEVLEIRRGVWATLQTDTGPVTVKIAPSLKKGDDAKLWVEERDGEKVATTIAWNRPLPRSMGLSEQQQSALAS